MIKNCILTIMLFCFGCVGNPPTYETELRKISSTILSNLNGLTKYQTTESVLENIKNSPYFRVNSNYYSTDNTKIFSLSIGIENGILLVYTKSNGTWLKSKDISGTIYGYQSLPDSALFIIKDKVERGSGPHFKYLVKIIVQKGFSFQNLGSFGSDYMNYNGLSHIDTNCSYSFFTESNIVFPSIVEVRTYKIDQLSLDTFKVTNTTSGCETNIFRFSEAENKYRSPRKISVF